MGSNIPLNWNEDLVGLYITRWPTLCSDEHKILMREALHDWLHAQVCGVKATTAKKKHLKRAFNISKNNNRGSKSSMMCNYWLLHHEKYVWAWSRGLQNTVPALASTHHIRQQFIKEKQQSGISAKDHAHLFWKWLTQKLKPITRSCKLWSQENVEFEENGLICATHKSLIYKTGTIIVVWLLFCCFRE